MNDIELKKILLKAIRLVSKFRLVVCLA